MVEPGTSRVDIVRALRDGTAAQHRALEEALPLARPDIDRDTYVDLLRRFYQLYAGLEAALEPHGPRLLQLDPQWPRRHKAPLLARDLRALGQDVPRNTSALGVPDLAAWPAALGSLYVTEGSTLGGQVLSRLLARRLQLTPEHGAAFFAGYGPNTGRMWKDFCHALSHEASQMDRPEQIVTGAQETFRCFHRWLTADLQP